MKSVALYIHLPFCISRCTYCDFNAHLLPRTQDPRDAYLQSLISEIKQQKNYSLSSLFIGGGTPTLLSADQLDLLLQTLHQHFHWPQGIEASIEANPATIDPQQLEVLKKHRVDRLSLGVQTFFQDQLELLGRDHKSQDIEKAVSWAKGCGFDNINLDLIYGLPQQKEHHWRENLERALALNPQHLSLYQLTIEPHTRLAAQIEQNLLQPADEDELDAMEETTLEFLSQEGWEHYEISNWCQPQRACQHNLHYWRDLPYLGLGCGATSLIDGWRYQNILHPRYYIQRLQQGASPIANGERLSSQRACWDTVMTALRTHEGFSLSTLSERYPTLEIERVKAFFEHLPSSWYQHRKDQIVLTQQGWDQHNTIYLKMMDLWLFPEIPSPDQDADHPLSPS